MDVKEKLKILSAAAKFDVSCSSSGSRRKNVNGGIGNAAEAGICHSWAADGRCISLLKVLFTNDCIFDCAYCANRSSNDVPRASFEVDDLVDLTVNFYLRNYIEGLFLSSAIKKNPDDTMESLLRIVKKLRTEKKFNGYIHVKAIPGADSRLISETGRYVDRMSVNIELPTSESLKLLAPQKSRNSIFTPMGQITDEITRNRDERKSLQKAPLFVPAGQSTQLIVGATPESDLKIITLTEALYRRYGLKRVYYSAYIPINSGPNLPALPGPPLLREHRLYQADWLMRFYGFTAGEILDQSCQSLDSALDPKAGWALRNMGLFPVEINSAPYEMILRIPGVGVRSAEKIVAARRAHSLSFEDLKKIGVAMKRAKYFITCNGKFFGETKMDEALLRRLLTGPTGAAGGAANGGGAPVANGGTLITDIGTFDNGDGALAPGGLIAGPKTPSGNDDQASRSNAAFNQRLSVRRLLTDQTESTRRITAGEQLTLFTPESESLFSQVPDAATSTTGEF